MTLAESLLRQLDDQTLSHDERVLIRCEIAADFEHRGQYEAARAKRLEDFERSRHQTRWEVEGVKWSLSDLDRKLKELGARARVFSRPGDLIPRRILSPTGEGLRIIKTLGKTTNLLPSGRRRAAAEAERLTEVRARVERNIAGRRETLRGEREQAARMTATLGQLWEREADGRRARGQAVPPRSSATSN